MELDTEGLDSIVRFDTLALLQEAETSHTRRETTAIGSYALYAMMGYVPSSSHLFTQPHHSVTTVPWLW